MMSDNKKRAFLSSPTPPSGKAVKKLKLTKKPPHVKKDTKVLTPTTGTSPPAYKVVQFKVVPTKVIEKTSGVKAIHLNLIGKKLKLSKRQQSIILTGSPGKIPASKAITLTSKSLKELKLSYRQKGILYLVNIGCSKCRLTGCRPAGIA